MKKHLTFNYLLRAGIASVLAGICLNANASAFQLFEYNGVNAGDFGAGAAAIANDASTAYANPAGMVLIPNPQIVLSESAVSTDVRYSGTETWRSNSNLVPANYRATQTGNAQGGVTKFIPALHYVTPLSNNWAFGFSLMSPFGLITNFGDASVVRYSGTDTELKTIDISPALAFKVNDKIAIGAGIDFEYLNAVLDETVGAPYEAGLMGHAGNAYDTESNNEADGWGVGWHTGLLYQFTPDTRIGLTYHSQIRFNLNGSSKLAGPLANQASITMPGVLRNNNLAADITLPPATELGVYHAINQQWAVDGSVIYTQWNVFNDVLNVQNVQGVYHTSLLSPLQPQTLNVAIPLYFHNTWRVAAGVNYKPVDKWLLRAGAGYDESPVKNTYRGVRLPDSDRYALAVGAHYQAIKTMGVDVGWTHLFIKDADVNIDAVSGSQIANTTGRFSNHADIIGAQLTWDIA